MYGAGSTVGGTTESVADASSTWEYWLTYGIETAGWALVVFDVVNTIVSPTPDVGIIGASIIGSARAARGTAQAVTHGHHAWPKYLGGPAKQDLARLPKSVHDAFHSGLDKILPRQRGTAYYEGLSPAARQQLQRDLADYTRAFDAKYGTQLYESMIRNGFPGT
jgi:hypothetical protein